MPTAIITLPGVLADVPAGMEEAIILNEHGLPERGLAALHLFGEGVGAALGDELGGAAGAVDSLVVSNNAFAWLAGGGIQLSGAQLASMAAFEANSAWTLFSAIRVVNHTGAAGVEKIVGLLSLRNWGAAQIRGCALYQRGATNLSIPSATAYYSVRGANGAGGQGVAADLLPFNHDTYNAGRLVALSYNGVDTIRGAIYDKTGALLASGNAATTDANLFTIAGVTTSDLQWALGGVSALYDDGVVQHECAARYSRALTDFSSAEIALLAAGVSAIGAGRGRAW